MMIPISILDLAHIVQGGTAAQALVRARELAQLGEKLGYQRFWLAEHHNMPGIASAATAVAIAYVAGGTSTIRVGSGGVMLPNHAPLVIAEQFGTLESLFPGRIDLGLGRAPGTDPLTARALMRGRINSADTFPQDVMELRSYFRPAVPGQAVRAVPGSGLKVPIWLLGSSLFSAKLAASLGLPFAFASHFAPDLLQEALDLYRDEFRASASLARPYAMAAVAVFAAPGGPPVAVMIAWMVTARWCSSRGGKAVKDRRMDGRAMRNSSASQPSTRCSTAARRSRRRWAASRARAKTPVRKSPKASGAQKPLRVRRTVSA